MSGAPLRVLAFSDYYLPGGKGGGSVRSLANLATLLDGSARFRVATRDRDIGDEAPYPGIPAGWTPCGHAEARYLAARDRRPWALARLLRETAHDVVYLNSAFSPAFTLPLLALRRLGRVPSGVVVAPRGELAPGALSVKPGRKRAFLAAARAAGLYGGVVWHATADIEADDIRRELGPGADVHLAEDVALPIAAPAVRAQAKRRGRARLVFLSRVSPKKNLLGGIEMLAPLAGRVELDVYGPVEDAAYWARCQEAAAAAGAGDWVRYRGAVDHARVGEVLAGYDAFYLPTLGENFGHVVAEALQAGCPVLLSDRTPWRDLASRRAGWDLPLEDAGAFRGAASALAEMDDVAHAPWREGARRAGAASVAGAREAERTMRMLEAAAARGRRRG